MSYQVLARKWRPQTFDEVVGQRGVTDTLRNAIASGRIAQSFIFAGARGVGKTTTARILAKALNCVNGPTAAPCGACDACVEIAEGRDMDVLEIDAATHTGIDNVREVIISGLGIRPVRDRYKIFIIDEVHQLSGASFNALLKSVEEPPPHVVFMMATTELHKIPDTIRSRSQEFEFRTIGSRAIADQLRRIAAAEGLQVEPAALQLLARSAEGSLRDAESALDQVLAFAGETITTGDVVAVLGLVGRDLLLDVVETVADEDAARVFDLVGRATEAGLDLRLLARELSRVVRDMMVVAIDPARLTDPEFTPDGDVDRLRALAARFSREDLLRAFDVIARAELDVRTSAQPRYALEMALLKWVHLRKLAPLGDVIQALESGRQVATTKGGGPSRASGPAPDPVPPRVAARPPEGARADPPATQAPPSRITPAAEKVAAVRRAATTLEHRRPAPGGSERDTPAAGAERPPREPAPAPVTPAPAPAPPALAPVTPTPTPTPVASAPASVDPAFKEAFLEEIRRVQLLLHRTVVAQAARIDVEPGAVVFAFGRAQRGLRTTLEQHRVELEAIAERVAGRKLAVRAVEVDAAGSSAPAAGDDPGRATLMARAAAEPAVQNMLDVFRAEIRDVEEIED